MKEEKTSFKYVVLDFDGTLTLCDTFLFFVLYFVCKYPKKAKNLPFLFNSLLKYKMGVIDNCSLKENIVKSFLRKLPRKFVEEIGKSFMLNFAVNVFRLELVNKLKEHHHMGHKIVLLSSSLDLYLIHLKKLLPIDAIICTETEDVNGILTGKLKNCCFGNNKVLLLEDYLLKQPGPQYLIGYADDPSDSSIMSKFHESFWIKNNSTLIGVKQFLFSLFRSKLNA